MSNEKTNLALRVYKRTNKFLLLLWKRMDGVDPLKTEITFRDLKSPNSKTIKIDPKFVQIDVPTAKVLESNEDANISAETVVCLIREQDAGLSPDQLYYIKVKYGSDEEGIRLTPAGVFPSHEREDRQRNRHLYLWDDEAQCWRKASGVRGPKGQFFLGVVQMPSKDAMISEEGDN